MKPMIPKLPFWLLVLFWFLQSQGGETLNALNAGRALVAVDMFSRSMPVPRNWLQRWLTAKVQNRLDAERDALLTLQNLNLIVMGVIPK